MLPITFLSHLPTDLQGVITFCLKDPGSQEDNLDFIKRKCAEVAPKCEVYLSYSASLAALTVSDREMDLIQFVLGMTEMTLEYKILCIDKVLEQLDREIVDRFREKTRRFLNECIPPDAPPPPPVPKPQPTPIHPVIPVEPFFPVLDKIDRSLHGRLKPILSNLELSCPEKFGEISQVVTDPEQLKLLKEYLRGKDAELKFLNQFPEQVRGEVAVVLREASLSFQTKMDLLKHILPKSEHRKLCRDYLKNQKQAEKQQKEAIRFLNSFDEDEVRMNVLVLGETGVGKSTFINGLANYFKYANLHEAKAKGPEILISTKFTQWSGNRMHTIYCPAPNHDGRNENLETGQSSTQDPKFYRFYGELLGKYRELNLLDTPGIGDVKGMETDAKNFENIFSCLADWGELHAVLILLKPNQSRLTECMTYCLGELFGRLNKNCTPNIIFCCTNTRSSSYTPAETFPTLQVLLNEIREKWGVEIPCHRQSVFSFDNESFRFLCASKQINYDEKLTDTFNQSWMNSVSEVFRLFTRINDLTPCNVRDTLRVFNTRTAINKLLEPLAKDQRTMRSLDQVIDDNEAKKERLRADQQDLHTRKHILRTEAIRRQMKNSRVDMVCTTCGEFDKHTPTEKHYKICHQSCNCPETSGARLNTASEVLVQKCQCFDQETFICKECNCPWMCHRKIDTELVQEQVKVLDQTVNQRMQVNIRELNQANDVVNQKMREKAELEVHVNFLENAINQLGAHLKSSCMLPYNDYLNVYAQKEIEDMRMQGSAGNADREKKIAQLQKIQAEYEQLVRLVDQIGSGEPTESVDSIMSKIRQRASRQLREKLTNMAWINVRSEQWHRVTAVDIQKGWMGKLRADLY